MALHLRCVANAGTKEHFMGERMAAGQTFPATTITLSDGNSMSLPGDMGDGWKVIIFYRGGW